MSSSNFRANADLFFTARTAKPTRALKWRTGKSRSGIGSRHSDFESTLSTFRRNSLSGT